MAVTANRERELKLDVEPDFALPQLGDAIDERMFVSTYFDTADRRLAATAITLRRRVENGLSLWQLKLPQGVARLEIEVAGGPSPPAELRTLLAGVLRGAALESVATLRTRRGGLLVRDREQGFAEVVLDRVSVLDGQRVSDSFAEVEVELIDGTEELLRRLGKALRRAGARPGDGKPKVLRALGWEPHVQPPLEDATLEQLRRGLRANAHAVLAHDPGVRLGRDSEEVHQQRVATRRLRALLRGAENFVDPAWAEPLRAELSWLADALGHVRDLDVLVEHLREAAEELDEVDRSAFLPLLERLDGERETARAELVQAMESGRYYTLLDTLEREPVLVAADTSLEAVGEAEFRKLRKSVRALGDEPTDDELHATRIKGKRARYAAELLEGKAARDLVDAAKRFQDVIGDHQDAIVAEERLRRLARGSSVRAALAVGRLVERQRQRRAQARAAVPEAWARLERASRRAFS